MPLLGSTMTIDAGSSTSASTNVFEEKNMTWTSRSTGGSSSSVSGAQREDRQRQRQPATTTTLANRAGSTIERGGGDTSYHSPVQLERSELQFSTNGASSRDSPCDACDHRSSLVRVESKFSAGNDNEKAEGPEGPERPGSFGSFSPNTRSKGAPEGPEDSSVRPIVLESFSVDTAISDSVGGTTKGARTCVENIDAEDETILDEVPSFPPEGDLLFHFKSIMEDIDDPTNDTVNGSLLLLLYSTTNSYNDSLYNETFIVLGKDLYPSGYSLIQIILASILATLLMIVIVVGNMLVIIAIATEKSLKNIQNWFIASLAVADFFLGLIIMPFSLANEIMGYWIFGYWWCDIYSAMDVLLCTASIMNLCLISLDRFWSITQAVDYLKKRTPARAALMIALVWLLSALVCIPPLLGWKRPTPEEEYPKCKLSEDIGYVLYSALGSFYIPSCIMVFVYIRIYFAAKARARRAIRKPQRPRPAMPPESPDIRQTSFTQSTPATDTKKPPGSLLENVATIENQPVQIPIVTCDFASDVSTSEVDPGGTASMAMEEKDTLKVSAPVPMQKSNLKASLSVNGSDKSEQAVRCRAPSVGIDVDMVSEFASSSDSGVVSRCAVVKPLKIRLCKPIFGRKSTAKTKRDHTGGRSSAGGGDVSKHQSKDDISVEAKTPKPRDPEREKRRLARKKEKRATLILGFIMGSFIACWLPFFLLYIVKPLFPDLDIPGQAFVIAFWLGYMNSALNPFIYTVFNKDFRQAFHRILLK